MIQLSVVVGVVEEFMFSQLIKKRPENHFPLQKGKSIKLLHCHWHNGECGAHKFCDNAAPPPPPAFQHWLFHNPLAVHKVQVGSIIKIS